MYFIIIRAEPGRIIRVPFRHQVPSIRRGIDQDIVRPCCQPAFQNSFELTVNGFIFVKRKIITEQNKAFRSIPEQIYNLRQIFQVEFFNLDHTQTLAGETG